MNWRDVYRDMLNKGIVRTNKQGDQYVSSYQNALNRREKYHKFAELFTHGALYGLNNMAFDDTGESNLYVGVDWMIVAERWEDVMTDAVKVILLEEYTGNQCHLYRPKMPSQS